MKTKLEMELEITQEIVDAIAEKMIASGDYVPVVRCKDCKHWEHDVIFQDGWCGGKHQGNPDWFCADGERKPVGACLDYGTTLRGWGKGWGKGW